MKQIRIIWIAMLVAAIVYVWIPEQLHLQPKDLDSTLSAIFIVLAIALLPVIIAVRKATIGSVTETLRNQSSNLAALQKWRTGQIVTIAMCEAIVLYGLVLRFLGATQLQAAPLYALGIGLMIVFWPKEVQ